MSKHKKDWEPLFLPLQAKEEMVRKLLSEMGVTRMAKVGDEFRIRCLFPRNHPRGDRNPSAYLSFDTLTYICFSCGSQGGLLWLLATTREQTAREAMDWVEGITGLGGEAELGPLLELLEAIYEERGRGREPIPTFSPRALEPWAFIHPWLTDPQEEGGRGIPAENVVRMQVGYAEAYPMGEGRPTSERIVVPHFWKGKLVGWQSRRLNDDDGTDKWLSTEGMPKDRTIYALDEVEGSVGYVVESPMSVLRHIHHLPICSTFGRNITDTQVRLLAERFERVVYWPDSDMPGWRVVEDLAERMDPYVDFRVVESDWVGDPANLDDDTAAEVAQCYVPAQMWAPPERLRCWACRAYHSGECEEAPDEA